MLGVGLGMVDGTEWSDDFGFVLAGLSITPRTRGPKVNRYGINEKRRKMRGRGKVLLCMYAKGTVDRNGSAVETNHSRLAGEGFELPMGRRVWLSWLRGRPWRLLV